MAGTVKAGGLTVDVAASVAIPGDDVALLTFGWLGTGRVIVIKDKGIMPVHPQLEKQLRSWLERTKP